MDIKFFIFSNFSIPAITRDELAFDKFCKEGDHWVYIEYKEVHQDGALELKNIMQRLFQKYGFDVSSSITKSDRLIIYFENFLCFIKINKISYNKVDYTPIIVKTGILFISI